MKRGVAAVAVLVWACACGGSGTSGSPGAGAPSSGGSLAGCPLFPADNAWNRDVSSDPVGPASAAYIAAMNGGSRLLHPDFGSDPTYGIPWTTVPGSQPRVPMSFDYADESDPGPYPFPPDAPVEAGGARHVLALDRDACRLHEPFDWRDGAPGPR